MPHDIHPDAQNIIRELLNIDVLFFYFLAEKEAWLGRRGGG